MPRLIVANVATAVPMGAQVYQEQVASRASGGLGSGWTVDRMVVRSMRSPMAGTHRLPMRFMTGASGRTRRELGRVLYPRHAVVHRMNLELPLRQPRSPADFEAAKLVKPTNLPLCLMRTDKLWHLGEVLPRRMLSRM